MQSVAATIEPATMYGKTFKTCACGCTYTREQWGQLPYVGPLDDGVEVTELRNCTCGSTLGIVIGPSPTVAALELP